VPGSGSATTETDNVTVGADISGLAVGTYLGTLTVTATGATNTPQTVDLTLVVTDPNVTVVWPTNGWATATPAEMGMDEAKLIQARDYALNTYLGGGAGIITRHGRAVMTWGNTQELYGLKSGTKSIGSTILGLAVKDGLMSLSDLAQQHHPSLGIPPESNAATGWLDDITIQNLATHTAGFMTDGGYEELFFEPGTAWSYSDGGPNWIAEAVTLAYGTDLLDVLADRIMSPLGVAPAAYYWRDNVYRDTEINGITSREFGAGISTSVDVMARIGYLYLRDGMWDGTQIIPASYVAAASAPVPGLPGLPVLSPEHPNGSDHYGLLWWNNADGVMPAVPLDAFLAWGLYEGFIIVIPSLDIVVARLGGDWRVNYDDPFFPVLAPFLTLIVESVVVP
jgi:CubicO group peptidase (beta-lactamase class C family)